MGLWAHLLFQSLPKLPNPAVRKGGWLVGYPNFYIPISRNTSPRPTTLGRPKSLSTVTPPQGTQGWVTSDRKWFLHCTKRHLTSRVISSALHLTSQKMVPEHPPPIKTHRAWFTESFEGSLAVDEHIPGDSVVHEHESWGTGSVHVTSHIFPSSLSCNFFVSSRKCKEK